MKRKKLFTGDAHRDISNKLSYRKKFIQVVEEVFFYGYQDAKFSLSTQQCINRALMDNPDIVSGVVGRWRYDYHLVMVSRGKLGAPQNVSVAYLSKEEAVLKFHAPLPNGSDKKRYAYIFQYNACRRESRVMKLAFEGDVVALSFRPGTSSYGDELRYWVFISSGDNKERSDSVYIGQITPLCN